MYYGRKYENIYLPSEISSVAGSLLLLDLLLYDELLLDWLDSDLLRLRITVTIFCSALVCLLHWSFGLHSVFLAGEEVTGEERTGDDRDEFRSGEGLEERECGSLFWDGGDIGCDTVSGEAGRDLIQGDPGADFNELDGLWGVFGPSPPDGGADEYRSLLSGESMFEPASLGDLGPSGDLGPAGEVGIEFSGEFISECAPLKLSGERGGFCGDGDRIDDWDRLSGDGDRGPSDLGDMGDRGGDLGGDFPAFLELSEDELRRLLELELLLLEDDLASPEPSRESSESIPEDRW